MQNEDIVRSIRVHLDEVKGCGGCSYYEYFPEATCFLHMIDDAANALELSEKNIKYLFDRVCELEEDNSELKELVPKWISVNERLPVSQELVIVSICDTTGDTKFSYTSFGWLTSCKEYWIVDGEENGCVTHWMKLPEPPKGE